MVQEVVGSNPTSHPRPRLSAPPRLLAYGATMIRPLALLLAVMPPVVPASAFWDPVTAECRPPAHRGAAEAIDGDTLRFARTDGPVDILRLVSVDAPELHQVCRIDGEPWDCGFEARAVLAGLLEGRELACMFCGFARDGARDALCRDGRTDIGEEMLRAGMATSHAYFANNLQSAESQAVRAGRGLWRGDWVHPAAWRKGRRLGEGRCGGCYLPE